MQQIVSAREADGDVSNAKFDAEFAVSTIQTLRRVSALISQTRTRFHDVTLTGGLWVLLSGVGFIYCYGQRWQGKLRIGRNLEPFRQTARKTLPKYVSLLFFHSCTVHLSTIKVLYLPADVQKNCFKRILKFTLKQLLQVSVLSPSSGSVLFELAKVIIIKIIS